MKGRSKKLISKRDESICRRYHYWTEEKRLRFDDALKILSEDEFFISEQRIIAVIRNARKIDSTIAAVPKVRLPHLTQKQLSLLAQ